MAKDERRDVAHGKDEREGELEAESPAAGHAKKGDQRAKADGTKSASKRGEAKAARDRGGHGDPSAHGHGHAVNRREYLVIFGILFVLTVLEVAVTRIPDIAHSLVAIALIALALTKAACVGLYYMHLKGEAKVLRLSVAIPF